MAENVVVLTDKNFEQEVSNSETPVLVDFSAEWCMPCKMLAPTIEELAGDYAGRLKVGSADTDQCRQAAIKFSITSIPTIVVLKGGQIVKKFVGLQQKADLAAAIDEVLAE